MLKDWSTGQIQDLYENDNFRARVYWRTGRARIACVCFRGTANWKDTVYADIGGIGLGLNALAMKINDAVTFTSMIARKADIVWLTGHSLGGAFVQIVGAICQLPGVTWNAPGCLALMNQMSSNPVRALVGGAGSAGVSMLSSLITAGIGGQVVTLLNKAAAAGGDDAFAPIVNFRGNMDPVSLVGAHVGLPLQTIQLASQSPHPHSMVPLIQALENRTR
ncbi:hypothetical protein EJV46_10475 [Roseococcus sp. SYP-B2431]|uniref:hypothetical protein n=1 Tax=Roseococcus sp. SYP-B2431 TaxID=2496640 RepID=UPI00103D8C49|nr:hypothetical protein [Roseococcus sp. SYP-B2431]TCH98969.1 hypothetical protein EJV46_10475 [Roseococcus sp. SYP-B2431]